MGAIDDKYHCKINGEGYILARMRGGKQYYEKKRAPHFVNKFGSGDSSYRDATFWQFMAQTNWRNGAQQLKFDDPGKFWKSENLNVNQLEQVTLSKALTLIGQTASGEKVNTLAAWRSSQSWWSSNYGYRQKLTITADADYAAPEGYPVKITIDTAALETASKVRSDRKDWRVVYWNGSGWEDIKRDYIAGSITFFPLQAAIAKGESDNNYYVYYGYSSESTDKQPTSEDDWNEVYQMYGKTPDAYTKGLWHFREGSGTTVNDDSSRSNHGSASGSPTWGTDGLLGRYMNFDNSDDRVNCGTGTDLDLGSFTIEGWVYLRESGYGTAFAGKWGVDNDTHSYRLSFRNGKLEGYVKKDLTHSESVKSVESISLNGWYHVAIAYDGNGDERLFIDGVQCSETDGLSSTPLAAPGKPFYIGWNAGNYLYGRLQHLRVSNTMRTSFPYVIPAANQPSVSAGSEETTQPPASSFDLYAGVSDGKIYKWDGIDAFSEQFDCRRLEWYESGEDVDKVLGDTGGVETAQAQSFKVDAACTIKAVEMYLKKAAGTPGDITVRIETDSSGPTGTLAHTNAATTITAFAGTSYAWKEAVFASTFALAADTTYWLVLKTAAAANDNNYNWRADESTPSYSDGSNAHSEDGGSSWTVDAATDMYFRIKGDETEVNCSLVSSVGGTQKMLFGVGNPESEVNTEARIYSYDGTSWALEKVFDSGTSSQVLSLEEYESSLYAGVGPKAVIYSGTDPATWTESKDINKPQNPGYPWKLKEYNRVLYAGGGSPEFLDDKYYNGFLFTYDQTTWDNLYPFSFTVIRSLEFYDAYLFIGTYHGHLFVYDTASLSPLFSFKDLYEWRLSILDMKYYDDKLYIATYPQENSNETNVGIWVYDRHGLSNAYHLDGITGYRCMEVVNNLLMVGTGDDGNVYKIDPDLYATQGHLELSYFDANLPSINKLWAEVQVKHKPLETGQSIVVYYKFKESDDWTTLGTSDTVDAESADLSFNAGTYSKKIILKIELNSSNTSITPALEEVIMKYTKYPTTKWMWNIRLLVKKDLQLLDKTTHTKTAAEMRADLESAQEGVSLITFQDVNETEYTVLFHDLDNSSWVINQEDTNENQVSVTLIEA